MLASTSSQPVNCPRACARTSTESCAADDAGSSAPRVWALASRRAGDASQVVARAEALGWPFEIKRLRFRRSSLLLAPPFTPSVAGIDPRRSAVPVAPWPDLV